MHGASQRARPLYARRGVCKWGEGWLAWGRRWMAKKTGRAGKEKAAGEPAASEEEGVTSSQISKRFEFCRPCPWFEGPWVPWDQGEARLDIPLMRLRHCARAT